MRATRLFGCVLPHMKPRLVQQERNPVAVVVKKIMSSGVETVPSTDPISRTLSQKTIVLAKQERSAESYAQQEDGDLLKFSLNPHLGELADQELSIIQKAIKGSMIKP